MGYVLFLIGFIICFLIGFIICFFIMLDLHQKTLTKIYDRGFYQHNDNFYIVTKKDIEDIND